MTRPFSSKPPGCNPFRSGRKKHIPLWNQKHGKGPFVYFIEDPIGPIKVGISKNPPARLSDLQTSHARRLRLLAIIPGDYKTEAALHELFRNARLSGEWFAGVPVKTWLAANTDKFLT